MALIGQIPYAASSNISILVSESDSVGIKLTSTFTSTQGKDCLTGGQTAMPLQLKTRER